MLITLTVTCPLSILYITITGNWIANGNCFLLLTNAYGKHPFTPCLPNVGLCSSHKKHQPATGNYVTFAFGRLEKLTLYSLRISRLGSFGLLQIFLRLHPWNGEIIKSDYMQTSYLSWCNFLQRKLQYSLGLCLFFSYSSWYFFMVLETQGKKFHDFLHALCVSPTATTFMWLLHVAGANLQHGCNRGFWSLCSVVDDSHHMKHSI